MNNNTDEEIIDFIIEKSSTEDNDDFKVWYDNIIWQNDNIKSESEQRNSREMYDWHKKFKNENAADNCIKTSLNQHWQCPESIHQ